MNARDAARKLLEIHDRIAANGSAVAGVELNHHLFLRAVEEGVPWHLAFDGFELNVVVVVTNSHPMRFYFVGKFAEDVGGFLPGLAGLGVLARQARHDEKLVAQRLVEFDGLRKVVAEQRVEADVSAAAFEPDVVEQLAQAFGVAPVVAGELDRLVAHLCHRGDGAVEVFCTLVTH